MHTNSVIACVLVVTATLAHVMHERLDRLGVSHPKELHDVLPSKEALGLMSLTYDSLVADYYWLRTINEFGDIRKHRAKYPNLIALTQRVLYLDPYFKTGYMFAGTALTVNTLDPHYSVELLEKGMRFRPDAWEVPFYLGFNYYYFLGDFERAASAMAQAALVPGAPEVARGLATRLAAEAGRPEVGIHMIDSILETIDDETTRKEYIQRRNILLTELRLSWLRQAVEHYRAQQHVCPTSLNDLVESGLMREIPEEPLGGRWQIRNCQVITTSKYERLRLHGRFGVWHP